MRARLHVYQNIPSSAMSCFRINPTMKSLLLLSLLFIITSTGKSKFLAGEGREFWPAEPIEYKLFETVSNDIISSRRRLAPFQLCLLCKCCAGGATCATMPCCFGIDCQLPNKPYGVCAFVPKTCNCTSCSV